VTSLNVLARFTNRRYTDILLLDMQNQVAHSLTLLFLLSYTTTWNSFFNDYISMIQKNAASGEKFEPFLAQIFLKVLSMIDEEVADATYAATKKPGDQQTNAEIKDRIRLHDVRNITQLLFQLMTTFQSDHDHDELVKQCLAVVGRWIGSTLFPPPLLQSDIPVAWIDINLIVNDPYISLIYRFLGHSGLRAAASEALTNIVSKKMGSGDKLELITFLNLTRVVNALDVEKDVEFSEQVARLVNIQGLELTRILMEVCYPCASSR
jgi:exportin-T